MLSAIIDRVKSNLAIRQLRKLPAVATGRVLIEQAWTNKHEVIKDFTPEFVRRQAEKMMEEVVKIAVSADPRMANRTALADCVCEFARFQVLVIDPPPADDQTGLRGQLGITGELKPRLYELYQADKSLQEFLHGLDEPPKKWDDVWNPVLARFRMCHAWTHVFGALRLVFEDSNPASHKDWFRPFIAAMCGFQESTYRRSLGLPCAFGDDFSADLKPLMLSTFTNCVLDGSRYPDLEWNNRMAEVERGDYAWRANSWLERTSV
jgi:hypothetical protein